MGFSLAGADIYRNQGSRYMMTFFGPIRLADFLFFFFFL